jgi:hypothetical protein
MKNLFKALADFQQEVPVIHKDTKGFGYSYADLPAIFEKINPLLKKHGLGFTQLIQGTSIETIVFHIESGDQLKSNCDIPQGVELKGMNQFQVLGSAITYLRRYALSSALGLVTDKDTDAAGEQPKKIEKAWLNENTAEFNAVVDMLTDGRESEAREYLKGFQLSKKVSEKLTQIANNLKTA